METTGRIELPRTLVTALLHWAVVYQEAKPAALVRRSRDGGLSLQPIGDGTAEMEAPLDAEPYAVVCAVGTEDAPPEAEDIRRWGTQTGLFLTVFLGTRGVLQLRGWQVGARGIEPREVGILDGEEAPG